MDFASKNFKLGIGGKCIVIGEIGVNHNNSAELLFQLIDAGIDAGVDVIKLQRFKAGDEISSYAPKANYQTKNAPQGESQLEMAQKLELSDELLCKAFDYCKQKGVGFLCAAFDHESIDFIADVLKCQTIKIPSPEITNKPLLEHAAKRFSGCILSTGASTLAEVMCAVDCIQTTPDIDLCVMHCVSEYPAPIEQANLSAIKTLQLATSLPIGYSDHTVGIVAGVVAASLGAVMVEKHFTLDKSLPGPDHKASADIGELRVLVRAVQDACASIGTGLKKPAIAESANRKLIRKSIVCNANKLGKGTKITREMLGIKRPETPGAVLPEDINKIIGLAINQEKTYDEPICWSDFR